MIYDFKQKCLNGYDERIIVTDDFIQKNNLELIPSEDIQTLIVGELDILNFKKDAIIGLLPWNLAKKYFNIEYIQEIEKGETKYKYASTTAEATQDFLDYMVFAWMKASDERSISASRSIQKLSIFMKALSRDAISDILEDPDLYSPYGKPALLKACEMLGINYPKYLET